MQSCRRESAALERLDCYDRLLAPLSPSGFDGALVKAGFVGEAWTRATEQEKRREGNTTELLVTQVPGERPTVVITTPAIGHVPPRPVLMFSCVDNITRMQVALMHPLDVHDIAVTLNADNRALRSHWFVRENGTLLESSRGLSGIDEIKQLFGAKTLTVDIEVFSQNAATAQRDALSGELAKLAQCWQSHNTPELAQATDDLFALYQRAFNRAAPAPVPTPAASGSSPQTTATSESGVTQPSAPAPQIVIDSHDDKAWRDTLLKVAAILCERQPDSPQGYRLRRHALWQNITSTPQAESDGRTPLAAVSADMVADYHAQLGSADMALWQQVEKSVLLAPYWLDGHCLSAQTALRLGYKQVADAIRDEVIRFLERLPQLTGLLFNDHTPFISEQTKQWLAASPDAKVAPVAQIGEESKAARACFAEQGLEAALRYLDMLPEGDPRDQFHRQYLAAQLTEEAGLVQLAQQQYRMLFRMGLQMMVADWEPSLLEQLEQKFTAEQ